MSFRRALTIVFVLVLCLHLGFALNKSCEQDHDCRPTATNRQFCKDRICNQCITCKDHNRNTGLSSSCLKEASECGSCLDGYEEMRPRYFHTEKSCVKSTELASLSSKRDMVAVEGSSEEAPSHSTATAITIGIVVIAIGVASAAMIGVFMYMKRRRPADAGQPEDGEEKQKEKKNPPRVVELQTIVHANPNLARRQESEDETHALPTEISPITNNKEENEHQQQTETPSNDLHKDTVVVEED